MIGMIIWGSGGDSVELGIVEHRDCEVCENERPFKLLLQYRYAHLYWVFCWITMRKYLLLCDVCYRGWELNTAEIEKTLSKDHIPFIRRWGWTFLVGLFVVPTLLAVLITVLVAIISLFTK
jgi:hypothetical protein